MQGVFFRAHTEELAKKLGVKGYVKNVIDGVEAVFEGDDEKIKDMLEFCAVGPEGAKVTNIDITEEKFVGNFEDFQVLH